LKDPVEEVEKEKQIYENKMSDKKAPKYKHDGDYNGEG
jgi:hypothetical protein